MFQQKLSGIGTAPAQRGKTNEWGWQREREREREGDREEGEEGGRERHSLAPARDGEP